MRLMVSATALAAIVVLAVGFRLIQSILKPVSEKLGD